MNTPLEPHDHIGAIDAGSNAIRFSLYRLNTRLTPVLQSRQRFPIRLGGGTFTSGALADEDMDAAILAFQEIARTRLEKNLIALPAVATSAIREATNCDDFLARVQAESGIELRAVTGEEEARLAALGVADIVDSKIESLIIDVGGGSSEVTKVLPGGEIAQTASLPMGAVRLAEQVGMPDFYDDDVLIQMHEIVRNIKPFPFFNELKGPQQAVCLGGTARALADAACYTGISCTRDKLSVAEATEATKMLLELKVSSIARSSGVDQERARIIIPGAYILTHVLQSLHIERFQISDAGVREGLIMDFLKSNLES